MKPISEALADILDSIQKGDTAFDHFINAMGSNASDYRSEQQELVEHYLDQAFIELELLLELQNAQFMLGDVRATHKAAAQTFMEMKMSPFGDPYSSWASWLRKYVRAVNTSLGTGSSSQVTKDIIDILRATAYSITDRGCFSSAPRNEAEVHVRIEAVLRCVFPDLLHEPPIGKPVKNFEPDTGLPSVRTLIEYKFVSTSEDVKRVADEVLADTRGYVSKEWDQFVYVIYETRRLKPERQWNELMRASGVAEGTQVIVISGEEPSSAIGETAAAGRRRPPKKSTSAETTGTA